MINANRLVFAQEQIGRIAAVVEHSGGRHELCRPAPRAVYPTRPNCLADGARGGGLGARADGVGSSQWA